MRFCIFDIESDGLLDTVTKIHCLSYKILDEEGETIMRGSLTDYDDIRLFIKHQECLVGHNIVRFDIPLMEKILGVKLKKDMKIIDTLGLSWYLFPNMGGEQGRWITRRSHGIEAWGEELGTKKIEISDWNNLTPEDYIHRCEVDVDITVKLWLKQKAYLEEIYVGGDIHRVISYLTFKLECAREQEENPITIDKKRCEEYLEQIEILRAEKTEKLLEFMPLNKKYKTVKKPKNLYKADGEISKIGEKWLSLLAEHNFSDDSEEISVIASVENGNPGSSSQIKDWLFSLGWIPTVYKDSVSKDKLTVKEVPQISTDGEICPNIKKLYDKYPYLKNLESLTILTHRKGVFEAFLESLNSSNQVQAKIDGFTNTLRMQHRKPIANLTKVSKPWGKEIRSLLTVPDLKKYILCGSDMASLEATIQDHYMYFFDKEYVEAKRVPGFDSHLDLGILAGLITKDEELFFKWYKTK